MKLQGRRRGRPVGAADALGRGVPAGRGGPVAGRGGRGLALAELAVQGTADDARSLLIVVSSTMITLTSSPA